MPSVSSSSAGSSSPVPSPAAPAAPSAGLVPVGWVGFATLSSQKLSSSPMQSKIR